MPRKKTASAAALKKEERLSLDRLWNTTDPGIKEMFFRFLDKERSRDGKSTNPDERAIIRLGLEYRHVLPTSQRDLLVRDARALELAM